MASGGEFMAVWQLGQIVPYAICTLAFVLKKKPTRFPQEGKWAYPLKPKIPMSVDMYYMLNIDVFRVQRLSECIRRRVCLRYVFRLLLLQPGLVCHPRLGGPVPYSRSVFFSPPRPVTGAALPCG